MKRPILAIGPKKGKRDISRKNKYGMSAISG
jgi:hypothetical protein